MKEHNIDRYSQEPSPQASGETKHTRYMEGVFTPLDSEEVQTACRKLWDELDKRNADLLAALDKAKQTKVKLWKRVKGKPWSMPTEQCK